MVRGVLQFRILYRTGQGEWKTGSLEGEYPFQETLMLENAGEFDMPQTEVFLEDLTVRMVNARKLNIQALLEIQCSARTRLELQIPVGMEQEESCEHLYQKKDFLELCYRGEELCSLRRVCRGSDGAGGIAGVCHLSGNTGRPHAVGRNACSVSVPA